MSEECHTAFSESSFQGRPFSYIARILSQHIVTKHGCHVSPFVNKNYEPCKIG